MSEHIHDREFQMAILKKTKANGWTPEDWMFLWIVVAGIGWIGFVAMVLLMNSLLNDLKEPQRRGGAERGMTSDEFRVANGENEEIRNSEFAIHNLKNLPGAGSAAGGRDAGMHGAVAQGRAAAPLGAGENQTRMNTETHG